MIRLLCFTRERTTAFLLSQGDRVEVWLDSRLLVDAPADLVLEILSHHFRGLQLTDELRTHALPPRKPLAPAIQAKQAERAAARRTRRPAP